MPLNYPNQIPVDYIDPQPIYGRPPNGNSLPNKVDVLIIGAGPAGLMAANALSSFGLSVRVIDQRPQSVLFGQGDGVQPRTIEVFQSYGLASRLLKEGNQMWYVSIHFSYASRRLFKHKEQCIRNKIWTIILPFFNLCGSYIYVSKQSKSMGILTLL